MPHRPTEEHILVPITPPAVTEDRAPAKTNRQDETQNTRISLGKQPGYFDSALEDVESVSSVDLSALSMPTGAERIRRRSVLERYKPFQETLPQNLHASEAIELPELSPVSEYPGAIVVPVVNRSAVSLHP